MSYLPPPSTLPPGSIVDSYRRDSGGACQDQSTDQQLTQIQEFCNQHGLTLRNNFVDEAKSGGSTKRAFHLCPRSERAEKAVSVVAIVNVPHTKRRDRPETAHLF